VPYCLLYDLGYTSLGGTRDTLPNPALRRESVSASGSTVVDFRPAYELVQDQEERLGREKEAASVIYKPTIQSGTGRVFESDEQGEAKAAHVG